MSSHYYFNFPKAIVTFGGAHSGTDFEKLQDGLSKLNTIAGCLSIALKGMVIILPKAACLASYSSPIGMVINVMSMLIGEVDRMHHKLKDVEKNLFNIIINGKLEALKLILESLRNTKISREQKVAEIVNAVTNLSEVHQYFKDKDSIYRVRYYIGAPLFICFCGIMKAICIIVEQTNGYSNNNLIALKESYQYTLDWYRNKCIGRRLASCYTTAMLDLPGFAWTYDWKNHVETHSNYYEEEASLCLFLRRSPWITYAKDLGGKGWRLWCGKFTYCKLVDLWDARPSEEVTFEKFKIHNTSALSSILNNMIPGHGVVAAVAVLEAQYPRDVLREYRRRVEKVMLEFFNDANVIC